jgi:hypothetical protein
MGNKPKIDEQLAALDTGLVMMRAQHRSQEQLQASFTVAADRIRAEAGAYRDYVSSRLLAIRLANDLGRPDSKGQ